MRNSNKKRDNKFSSENSYFNNKSHYIQKKTNKETSKLNAVLFNNNFKTKNNKDFGLKRKQNKLSAKRPKSNYKKPISSGPTNKLVKSKKYSKTTERSNLKKSYHKKKSINSFVYRIDYADPQRKRAKTSLSRELFLVKTKLLKFYNNIKKDQIRRYANTKTFKIKFKAARGYTNKALLKYNSANSLKKRLALNAFFSLVEHRLDVLLYRSNLAITMQQARQFINHRHVFVNEEIVTHSGFIINNFDIISLSKSAAFINNKMLLTNLKKRKVNVYPPKYITVDYRLMRACIVNNPLVKQIPFPFKIDLRKWLGLAKYMF